MDRLENIVQATKAAVARQRYLAASALRPFSAHRDELYTLEIAVGLVTVALSPLLRLVLLQAQRLARRPLRLLQELLRASVCICSFARWSALVGL
jgi:hypothetical protein